MFDVGRSSFFPSAPFLLLPHHSNKPSFRLFPFYDSHACEEKGVIFLGKTNLFGKKERVK
jgi:hypothetical protein